MEYNTLRNSNRLLCKNLSEPPHGLMGSTKRGQNVCCFFAPLQWRHLSWMDFNHFLIQTWVGVWVRTAVREFLNFFTDGSWISPKTHNFRWSGCTERIQLLQTVQFRAIGNIITVVNGDNYIHQGPSHGPIIVIGVAHQRGSTQRTHQLI